MIIKLDNLDFTFGNADRVEKEELAANEIKKVITNADWVRVDRFVMALMFLVAIVGSLVF